MFQWLVRRGFLVVSRAKEVVVVEFSSWEKCRFKVVGYCVEAFASWFASVHDLY